MHLASHASQPMLIIQRAAVLQLALIAFAVLAIGCLMVPEARRRLCETAARTGAARLRRDRRDGIIAELSRYAGEISVAASRAAATAERRHEEWVRAERAREAAWLAYEAADEAASRATRDAMYAVPDADGAGDLAANQRRLHDAATEAYRRGELSTEQLTEVLAQRGGWDPAMPWAELEARLRRSVRDKLLSAYRTASEMEKAARHAADTAAAAKRSLEDEAAAAAKRARAAGARPTVDLPRQRTAEPAPARS